jgi:hypothetical protein
MVAEMICDGRRLWHHTLFNVRVPDGLSSYSS